MLLAYSLKSHTSVNMRMTLKGVRYGALLSIDVGMGCSSRPSEGRELGIRKTQTALLHTRVRSNRSCELGDRLWGDSKGEAEQKKGKKGGERPERKGDGREGRRRRGVGGVGSCGPFVSDLHPRPPFFLPSEGRAGGRGCQRGFETIQTSSESRFPTPHPPFFEREREGRERSSTFLEGFGSG